MRPYDHIPWTASDKLRSIDRELKKRARAFPRFVAEGRMTQDEANREIAIFEAIRRDYAAAVEANPRAAGLLL
jgi:hypothetical protein